MSSMQKTASTFMSQVTTGAATVTADMANMASFLSTSVAEIKFIISKLEELSVEISILKVFGGVGVRDCVCKSSKEYAILAGYRKKQFDAELNEAKSFHAKMFNSKFF